MTKRILAIVMALVLSLSVLSFEAFADTTNMVITAKASGTTVAVSWNSVPTAATYDAELYLNGSQISAQTKITTTSVSLSTRNYYGTFSVNVTARDKSGAIVGSGSQSVEVSRSSVVNGITVTSSGSSAIVTWTADAAISSYYVSYTYYDSSNVRQTGSTSGHGTATISVAYDKLISVSVYAGSSTSSLLVGTWTNSGSSGLPSQTGSVRIVGTTLYWNAVSNAIAYRVTGVNANGVTVINDGNVRAGITSYDFSGVASITYGNYITFTVVATTSDNGKTVTVGSATYNPYGYGTGTGVGTGYLSLSRTGNNTYTVSWYDSYSGTATYSVSVNGAQQVSSITGTSCTIYFTLGVTNIVSVYRTLGGTNTLIGTATIDANGNLASNSGIGGGLYQPGSYTVNGDNCTLNVGYSTTTVTWNSAYSSQYGYMYFVQYTIDSTGRQYTSSYTYGNSVTINAGSKDGAFTANVILANYYGTQGTVIGSARYNGSNSSFTEPTSSKVSNLTLTAKSSNTTTVSWDPVEGAAVYRVEYSRAGFNAPVTQETSRTSFDIPIGKNVGFVVYVSVKLTNSSALKLVGSATHKAGDDYPSSSSSGNNNSSTDNTPAFVTNLKGVATDKQVSLSWDAAKGNPGYDIYWKRESANEWKKAASNYSKRAVNIKGLINGTSYQFKVVANGRDSGILTITPQASGSTTRTAADPDGGASRVPVITSATGGSGTISVEWSGVTGGNLYKVYLSTDGRSYTRYAQVTGTSATINNLDAGKYWVRIKASTNNGSTWTELKDCKEATVTVK